MPNNFNDIDYVASLIALCAGVWGAVLNFLRRDNSTKTFVTKTVTFFIDMTVNVGITMLIYVGSVGYGFNDLLSVALAGFLGHQGTRSFYIAELLIAEKLGAKDTFEEIKKSEK